MNFCTKCGRPRASAATVFCTHCGARLDPVATTPTVAETPPVAAIPSLAAAPPVSVDPEPAVSESAEAAPPGEPAESGPSEAQPYEPRRSEAQPYEREPYVPQPYEPSQSEPYQEYGDYAPGGSRRRKIISIAAAVVVVLLVGGAAAWLATRHSGHTPSAAGHKPTIPVTARQAATQTPTPTPTPSATPTPTPSPTPTPTATAPASTGLVSPGPEVAGEQDEASVQAFLDSYFAAINAHSYRQFRQLLSPAERARIPRSTFRSGDGTTTDSAAVLTSITSAVAGELAAAVTFTSHQAAADSPNDSSCTDWSITLYLQPQNGTYLIVPPPASYQASYGAC